MISSASRIASTLCTYAGDLSTSGSDRRHDHGESAGEEERTGIFVICRAHDEQASRNVRAVTPPPEPSLSQAF